MVYSVWNKISTPATADNFSIEINGNIPEETKSTVWDLSVTFKNFITTSVRYARSESFPYLNSTPGGLRDAILSY